MSSITTELAELLSTVQRPGDFYTTGTTELSACGDLLARSVAARIIDRKSWTFKAVEADRGHVEDSIRQSGCDLDLATDRCGRPYSLVCTKNQASYDRRAQQRKQDLDDVALLEAPPG